MKTVTRYEAKDGAIFSTEASATERDELIEACKIALSPLGKEHSGVSDGKGWVHHSIANVNETKRAILVAARSHLSGFNWYGEAVNKPETVHGRSIVGRILDDVGGPLRDAWWRIMTIDEQGREHQQPYYAINGPNDGQVCVEDRRKEAAK